MLDAIEYEASATNPAHPRSHRIAAPTNRVGLARNEQRKPRDLEARNSSSKLRIDLDPHIPNRQIERQGSSSPRLFAGLK